MSYCNSRVGPPRGAGGHTVCHTVTRGRSGGRHVQCLLSVLSMLQVFFRRPWSVVDRLRVFHVCFRHGIEEQWLKAAVLRPTALHILRCAGQRLLQSKVGCWAAHVCSPCRQLCPHLCASCDGVLVWCGLRHATPHFSSCVFYSHALVQPH